MALVRALNSAISGLNAQQIKIDTIGDNLANVTTTAFKQTRTLFSTLLSQTLNQGQAPTGTLGGIDPKQIGLGVRLSKNQHIFSQGALKATGLNTDLAIEGDGFFVFEDQNGQQVYTRDGALSLNSEQNLFHNANTGFLIQGYQADFTNFIINSGVLTDINVPVGNLTIARETDSAEFEGNLNGGGIVASEGTILDSQRLENVTTGLPATLATALTDLGRDDPSTGGTIDFVLAVGDVITVDARKGGRPILDRLGNVPTFTVGSPPPQGGATLGDFVDFLEGLAAIHTGVNAGNEQNSAILRDLANPNQIVADALDGADTAVIVGAGTEPNTNSIRITDTDVNFVLAGVQVGDLIRFGSGAAAGTIGQITAVAPAGVNTIDFDQEITNATPTTGATWFIHEPSGTRLGVAAVVDPANETTRSAAGVVRMSANVGERNAIEIRDIRRNTDRLFTFTEQIAAVGESTTTRAVVYDSLGTPRVVDYTFALTGTNDSGNTFRFWADSSENSNNPGVDFTRQVGTGTIVFDIDGQFASQTTNTISIDLAAVGANTPLVYTSDFSRLTGFASDLGASGNVINESEVQLFEQDGFEQGTLTDFSVGPDGIVQGIFTNGQTRDIAQVVIARFPNNNGLLDVAENFFKPGVNAGTVQVGEPGAFGRGLVRGAFLEESNVELSEQFTDLVIAQRSFQANARTISVSNELLQELVNLV
ncbi:MAG: flagellar hook-basal body complex protein [Planctomycetes bacterium]|nr:flagellar hook-basal body complex protein [Planctomycetota bacterium]